MRYQAALSFALILFWSTSFLANGTNETKAAESKKATPAKIDRRHFQFPTEYSIGALQMMGSDQAGTEKIGRGIGTAKGSLSIDVPPGETILLEINPHCLEHPELLKNIHTAGINRLRITYLSMDDNDHSLCDKALQALPECKDLITLIVERSDTTDKGLAGFKSLSTIKSLWTLGSDLDGSILKETQKLKNLEKLNLMLNPLKSENFKYLAFLPHLMELNLNQANLSDDDFRNFPKCSTQLKRLRLRDNPKVTDKSLPALRQQTALENLDIRGTGISLEGVLSLKNLKLISLVLPVRRYRPNEIEQLRKAFPKATLDYQGWGIGAEAKINFGPLK